MEETIFSPAAVSIMTSVETGPSLTSRPSNRPLAALFPPDRADEVFGQCAAFDCRCCRDWHLGEPVLREMSDRTVIAVPRRPFATDAYGALPHTLTASDPEVPDPLREKLMACLRDTPQATQSEAAKALGACVITVKRLFAGLQKEKSACAASATTAAASGRYFKAPSALGRA